MRLCFGFNFCFIVCCLVSIHDLLQADCIKLELLSHLSISEDSQILLSYNTLNLTRNSQHRKVKIADPAKKQILSLLADSQKFHFCFQLQQIGSKFRSLIAIDYDFTTRILELKVSLRKNVLKVMYSPDWSARGVITERILLPDDAVQHRRSPWQQLCLSYQAKRKSILSQVNCRDSKETILTYSLPQKTFGKLSTDKFNIWIGQSSAWKGFFRGSMRELLISNDTAFNTSSYCHPLPNTDLMVNDVQESKIVYRIQSVEDEVEKLKNQLATMQKQIAQLQQCQCLPSCRAANGTAMKFNDTWMKNVCTTCSCTLTGIRCVEAECRAMSCDDADGIRDVGKCCPRCPKNCQISGQSHKHASNFYLRCLRCQCTDGSLSCSLMDRAKECPALNCPRYLQYAPKDKCCKKCRELDLCVFSKCGTYAHCISRGVVGFSCKCDRGFQGDPYSGCTDVDECSTSALACTGPRSVCVNVPGSFRCECKGGLKYDAVGGCRATCTAASCQRNSTCVQGKTCDCKSGWTGSQCDEDIDECSTNLVVCPYNSRCINFPGSYICQCNPGYKYSLSPAGEHLCLDNNECSGSPAIDHHCAVDSKCANVQGGHKCIPELSNTVFPDCNFITCDGNQARVKDGARIRNESSCVDCVCKGGVLSCKRTQCIDSCQKSIITARCCPSCHGNLSPVCDTPSSVVRSKDQCDTDRCPKLSCHEIVPPSQGQCCSRCRGDAMLECQREQNQPGSSQTSLTNQKLCFTDSRVYAHSHAVTVKELDDGSCLQCLCWNGHFCCKRTVQCLSSN